MWAVELVSAVAWPTVVVLVLYRIPSTAWSTLPDLLKRKWEFGIPGLVHAKMDAAEQQHGDGPSKEKLDPASPGPSINPRPAAANIETMLRKELQTVDAEKQVDVLLHALVFSRLLGSHEFVYNRIFGSQIQGLKGLNERGRVSVDEGRRFYQTYADRFPVLYDTYTFDQWLGFLLSNQLVTKNDNNLEITVFGQDFLRYLVDLRLTESKPW